MQKRFVILLHAGYWILYLLLLALLLAVLCAQAGRPATLFSVFFAPRTVFVMLVPNLIAFYFSYLFLFPRFLARKKLAPFVIGSVLGAFGAASVCFPAFTGLLGNSKPIKLYTLEIVVLLGCLMGSALIHMTMALGMRGFITWYNDITANEELRRKNYEVEASLLRSKLDPHFLFNTLNNIDVLIGRDSTSASHYLNQLCEILRFVLYETRVDQIPLGMEVAYLEKYIALQRLRVASPDYVTWKVTGETTAWKIAPMLLIPYVENAFKHAEGQRRDGVIQISVTVEGDRLQFLCSNLYQKKKRDSPMAVGLGNDLMERRLGLLYPGQYTLDVSDQDERYTVQLTITLEEYALHHH